MNKVFVYSPIASGTLHKIQYGQEELIWLGGDRLMAWDPSAGEYSIWQFNLSSKTEQLLDGDPISVGHINAVKNYTLLWLGGDQMVAVPLQGAGEIFLKYDRLVNENPIKQLRSPPPGSQWPGGKQFIYLGRNRVLSWDTGNYEVCRLLNGLVPLPRFESLSTVPPRLCWLGGDRLIGWDPQKGDSTLFRFDRGVKSIQPWPALPPGKTPPKLNLDLKDHNLVYLGGNCVLDWEFLTGRYRIWAVALETDINTDIEDYLELHPNVRDSIIWQKGGQNFNYCDWDLQHISGFYELLNKFFNNIAAGRTPGLSFEQENDPDTGKNRIGPQQWYNMSSARDASEIYLAHVAQSLWAEIYRKVDWKLHEYGDPELELLLQGKTMFSQTSNFAISENLYDITWYKSGLGMPTDPTKSYQFLVDNSIIKHDVIETIYELTRWIRDHLRHASNINGGQLGIDNYGYSGPSPIERMFNKVTCTNTNYIDDGPRYYAWFGCKSCSALLVYLCKSVNIPARTWMTWFDDGGPGGQGDHMGIDFPTVQLFLAHCDELYANPPTKHPTIEPHEIYIFETNSDYQSMKTKYTNQAPQGVSYWMEYWKNVMIKGMKHPTYHFVWRYWKYKNTGSNVLQTLLEDSDFSKQDAQSRIQQNAANLQAAIDNFITSNNLQGEDPEDALNKYIAWYENWESNR